MVLETLKLEPFSAEAHYELSRIYHEMGKTEKALEHLEKALKVWENADPGHPGAKAAREFAKDLKSSS